MARILLNTTGRLPKQPDSFFVCKTRQVLRVLARQGAGKELSWGLGAKQGGQKGLSLFRGHGLMGRKVKVRTTAVATNPCLFGSLEDLQHIGRWSHWTLCGQVVVGFHDRRIAVLRFIQSGNGRVVGGFPVLLGLAGLGLAFH